MTVSEDDHFTVSRPENPACPTGEVYRSLQFDYRGGVSTTHPFRQPLPKSGRENRSVQSIGETRPDDLADAATHPSSNIFLVSVREIYTEAIDLPDNRFGINRDSNRLRKEGQVPGIVIAHVVVNGDVSVQKSLEYRLHQERYTLYGVGIFKKSIKDVTQENDLVHSVPVGIDAAGKIRYQNRIPFRGPTQMQI